MLFCDGPYDLGHKYPDDIDRRLPFDRWICVYCGKTLQEINDLSVEIDLDSSDTTDEDAARLICQKAPPMPPIYIERELGGWVWD